MAEGNNSLEQEVIREIHIAASPEKVWAALTRPECMVQWMSESEISINTSWLPGSPFIIRGDMHGMLFENTGTVLRFEAERSLQYSHLSSLSELPAELHNYTLLDFRLEPLSGETLLTLSINNFPTEAIYRHMVFYWNVALGLLKRFAEA